MSNQTSILVTNQQTVDPAVSKVKFDRELEHFEQIQEFNRKRGIILLRSSFPDIVLGFMPPQIRPLIWAFAVKINFTNYDLEAPSIQFIDPITEEGLKVEQLPHRMPRLSGTQTIVNGNGQQTVPSYSELIQFHQPNNIPFLCIPGVREYHNHPAHSNVPWLSRRGSGEGSLGFLVEQLYKYGIQPINGIVPQMYQVQPGAPNTLQVQFSGMAFTMNSNLISK